MPTAPAAHATLPASAHAGTMQRAGRRPRTAMLAALLLGLGALPAAWADLGRSPSSKGVALPAAQRAAAQGAQGAAASAGYTTHTRQLDSGTVITEYASASGVVFALSWQGPTLPELDSLLGSYFPTFQSEAARSRAQRNIGTPLHLDTGALVLSSGGRMRAFVGHAYAPALVPAGVPVHSLLP